MAQRKRQTRARLSYKDAGVDIDANDLMVRRIQHALRRTYSPRVLSAENGFAGLFALDFAEPLLQRRYRRPVLVSGTDGVGSKLLLGIDTKRTRGLGIDLVAMSVNDILTIGAEPLFFLDYVACHRLDPTEITAIVESVSEGCKTAGCALLGGETAEMPAMYARGHFDLAGFCVGVVEHSRIIDGRSVEPGDILLGLASSGIHSNGYTLVRKLLERLPKKPRQSRHAALEARVADGIELGEPIADAVMRPTRIYAKSILAILDGYRRKRVVRAMAHITGGGLEGNLPRVIPGSCDAVVSRGSWPVPPVFKLLAHLGVDDDEMYRVFNMGIGFVLVVRPAFAKSIMRQLTRLGETVYPLGTIRKGSGRLIWK